MKTIDESKLRQKLERVIPLLDERQKRLFVAAEAEQIGYGGITLLSRLTGMSRVSIHSGLADLAVSYTHLDVYKRQGYSKRVRLGGLE